MPGAFSPAFSPAFFSTLSTGVGTVAANLLRINHQYDTGGFTFTRTDNIYGAARVVASPVGDVGPAKAGTLTARTDLDTGEMTIVGHGMTAGQKVDVFWDGGRRYGMTVGTIAGNVVPIDGGAGDDLPALTTDLTAMVPASFDCENLTGNRVVGIVGIGNGARGFVRLVHTDGSEIVRYEFTPDQTGDGWPAGSATNPAAGKTIDKVTFSQADANSAREMRCEVFYV